MKGPEVSIRVTDLTLRFPVYGVDSKSLKKHLARLTVGGSAWPAIWAHPVTGRPLELTLPELMLSDAITLEAALDDAVARNGAPVELEVRVGERVSRYVRTPNQGVYTVRVPTRAGSHEPVSLVIRTSADGQRHLGIRLRITERQR